jgi:hypothetical protein
MKRLYTVRSDQEPSVGFGIACRPWRGFHGWEETDTGSRCYCGMYRMIEFQDGPRVKPDFRSVKFHWKPKPRPEPRLGRTQAVVLRCLRDHHYWHRWCGWDWNGQTGTRRILDSLVKRGLVVAAVEKVGDPQGWRETVVYREVKK